MYEGWTRLLIVFLTHPGIIVPIPAPGMWSWIRGLWQASWVLVMHSFSEGTKNILAAITYWLVLFGMVYIQVAIALAKAET
jgi:hypothetical protein